MSCKRWISGLFSDFCLRFKVGRVLDSRHGGEVDLAKETLDSLTDISLSNTFFEGSTTSETFVTSRKVSKTVVWCHETIKDVYIKEGHIWLTPIPQTAMTFKMNFPLLKFPTRKCEFSWLKSLRSSAKWQPFQIGLNNQNKIKIWTKIPLNFSTELKVRDNFQICSIFSSLNFHWFHVQ